MAGKRKVHSANFKGKMALEAIKGLKPINVLASEYEVQPNQISIWKRNLKDNGIHLRKNAIHLTKRSYP